MTKRLTISKEEKTEKMQNKVIDKKRDENKYEKITIDTPYGTIESDSGNHFLDIATILVIILGCAVAKYVIVKKLKN